MVKAVHFRLSMSRKIAFFINDVMNAINRSVKVDFVFIVHVPLLFLEQPRVHGVKI